MTLSNRILTRKDTSARRQSMLVKVLSFHISNNHLSSNKKSYLKELFKEAKFYYNFLLSYSQKTIVDDFGNLIYPHNLKNIDTKNNFISVFNSSTQNHFDYVILYLSSQMKQKILDKVLDSIKGLSITKSKGRKTGKLKFKSLVNVPLKQYQNTFNLDNDCKYLNIQGFKESFKLYRNKAFNLFAKELGFKNLSLNDLIESNIIEIANAELTKSGFKHNTNYQFNLTIYINPHIYNQHSQLPFIHSNLKPRLNKNRTLNLSNKIDENSQYITPVEETKETYLSKAIKQFRFNLNKEQQDNLSCTLVGLDAGIASELTLNFNEVYKSIELNSRKNTYLNNVLTEIKLTQTELNKFIKRSKRLNKKSKISNTYSKSRAYYNIRHKLDKLWSKYENIKANMVNHVVSYLKCFKQVYFQAEMINTWHQDKLKGYGKKIQAGILGKVYGKLKLLNKLNPDKYIMLSKSEKTTKTCGNISCRKINNIKLNDRVYECSCGYKNDRDTHSAYNMITMSLNKLNNDEIQEFGRDSVKTNLVKNVTNVNNTKFNYEVIIDKLYSKSYIQATLGSFI